MHVRAIPFLLGLTLAFVWEPGAFAAEPDTSGLRASIQRVLSQKDVASSTVGIYAVDVDSGQMLYALNENTLFNPASNTKLVTAAAALDRWGPSHTIFTRISATKIKDGVVEGPLFLKGDGDPLILYDDVVRWALALQRQGIKSVSGGIVVDDATFSPGFIPPAFDQKNEDASYRAPIGAVSVNFNHVVVRVRPGEAGKPPKVELYPPNDHIEVSNKATTKSGKTRRLRISSVSTNDAAGTRIEIRGSIGTGIDVIESRKRIDNPSLFAGSIFKRALMDLGIEVSGDVTRGIRPEGTVSLYLHESDPLIYHLMLMNKWSNNFMAEEIFRVLGHGENDEPASTERAYERIGAFLEEAGLDGAFKVFNGSGLYDGNQYSPRHLGQLLTYMARHRYAPDFAATMAIGGVDGTLRKRLSSTDGELRGKTGTLNEVTALAGYVTTASDRRVAYVVLFNDTPVRAWRLRGEQDEIARAIAEFDQ